MITYSALAFVALLYVIYGVVLYEWVRGPRRRRGNMEFDVGLLTISTIRVSAESREDAITLALESSASERTIEDEQIVSVAQISVQKNGTRVALVPEDTK